MPAQQKIQAGLLVATPSDASRMKALADTYNAIGEVQHRGQKLRQRAKILSTGIRYPRTTGPTDAERCRKQTSLGQQLHEYRPHQESSGHLDNAARQFQQAQKIRADLLKDDPGATKVQRNIAMADFNQGLLDVKAENLAAAGKDFGESIRQFAGAHQEPAAGFEFAISYGIEP